jgi:hypothetical protein
MKNIARTVAAAVLAAAILFSSAQPSAAQSQCAPTVLQLADFQGAYAAQNLRVDVYPCGGVLVSTWRDGRVTGSSAYAVEKRYVDGSALIVLMQNRGQVPIIFNGFEHWAFGIKPDVPGRIMLVGVDRNANVNYMQPLQKISNTPQG